MHVELSQDGSEESGPRIREPVIEEGRRLSDFRVIIVDPEVVDLLPSDVQEAMRQALFTPGGVPGDGVVTLQHEPWYSVLAWSDAGQDWRITLVVDLHGRASVGQVEGNPPSSRSCFEHLSEELINRLPSQFTQPKKSSQPVRTSVTASPITVQAGTRSRSIFRGGIREFVRNLLR